jgi:putative endonuclease
MFYIYVLVEKETENTYIGYTSNPQKRIANHESGVGAKTTKRGRWQLVYYEAYLCKKDAINRERKLKQYGQSRTHLFRRIKNSLESTEQN